MPTYLLTYKRTVPSYTNNGLILTCKEKEKKTLEKILTATKINQLAHEIRILASYVLPPPVYQLKSVAANYVTKIIPWYTDENGCRL
jgi:hypothetical protein